MLVHDFLKNSANRFPEDPCVIHDKNVFSYKDILLMSKKVATALDTLSVGKGERVGILLKNSVEYIATYYGCLLAGAITVPINTDISSNELQMLVNMAAIRLVFTEKRYHETIKNVRNIQFIVSNDELDTIHSDRKSLQFNDIFLGKEGNVVNNDPNPDAIASIIFTSGSTGRPKGVILTHRNIVANTKSIMTYLSLSPSDRIMVVLPFYYVYGKSLLNTHIAAGGSLIIENNFMYPNMVLEKMRNDDATGFAGVPSTFTLLLNRSSIERYSFPALRYITQAGGPMPPSVIKRVADVFAGKQIFIMYGATEASARLTYLDPSRLLEKLGSIGKAIPGVKIEIKREDGNLANNGEIGEIVAYGENIMKGYLDDPVATSKALKGAGYHTGDLAYRDDDGFIFLVGRVDDVIKIAGHKVNTREIEDLIYEIPGVHEAAVVGVNDDALGFWIKAFIVKKKRSSLTERDILDYCRSKFPLYKVPGSVKFLGNIPKNESGKYMKNLLI